MDLSRIKQLLPAGSDLNLESLYTDFKSKTGTGALDRFMLHLYQQNLIDPVALSFVADVEAVVTKKVLKEQSPDEHDVPQADTASGAKRDAQTQSYIVLQTIGRGGVGSVSLARDSKLHRYVAYKTLHSEQAAIDEVVERFDFEAQVTAQLDHPNIVPVYGYDAGEGYAMKLVPGRTLDEVLNEARRQVYDGEADEEHSVPALLEYFLKVCDAIHYAHSKGVVHRDLKPKNIMVGRYNEIYVVDWGIAKVLASADSSAPRSNAVASILLSDDVSEAHPRTLQGDILGSLGYMSPEQIRGEVDKIAATSDVFCLGLILYELVTLRPAYSRLDTKKLLASMANADYSTPKHTSLSGTAAAEIEAVIAKACALAPQDRYASADALAADIRRFLRGEPVSVRRDSVLQRITRWIGRHREKTLVIATILVLAGAATGMWSVYQRQRAVIDAKLHADQIASLVTAVAGRGQRIERHFLSFEAMVEGIAAVAAQLTLRGTSINEPTFTSEDYENGKGPDDFVESMAYRKKISLDWAVFKPAPDVAPAQLTAVMRKLGPLRHHFKQVMFESVAGTNWVADAATARTQILDRGAALTWAYVGLASGVHVAYPGKGGYPAEYDPRTRPWYRNSVDKQGTVWLPPYVDVGGLGLVVPCTRPLRSPDGRLLGVAGVEMTLKHIQANLLDMTSNTAVQATYLVDESGRVVAHSGAVPKSFAAGTLIANLSDLELYPEQAVVEAIRAGKSGHLARIDDDVERLVVYQQLGSVRWYLVAEATVGTQ